MIVFVILATYFREATAHGRLPLQGVTRTGPHPSKSAAVGDEGKDLEEEVGCVVCLLVCARIKAAGLDVFGHSVLVSVVSDKIINQIAVTFEMVFSCAGADCWSIVDREAVSIYRRYRSRNLTTQRGT